MDRLEELAGRVAHDLTSLLSDIPRDSADQVLETANLVAQLSEEIDATSLRMDRLGRSADAKTVLLVEPEAPERTPVVELLLRLGYAVLEAEDGARALEISMAHPGPIHVLLANILMPDISGRELAERISMLRPEISVVYMSGYTSDEVVFYGILGPGVAALEKPVREESLSAKLKEVLEAQYA
jgi:CheY-like chemotaxis protein